MRSIITILIISLLFYGCNSTEEKKDIDWQNIKKTRDGLDDAAIREGDLFAEIDVILNEWQNAQKLRDHGNIQAAEKKLLDASRGNFSILVGALTGEESKQKVIAAAALGFSEDIRAIPYLLDALDSEDNLVRSNAAMSIGSIGYKDTPSEKIFSSLEKETDSATKGMLYFVISRIVSPEENHGTLPILLKGLKDENLQVRNHSLITLAIVGDMEAAKLIANTTINDEDPTIRYNSIRTLGKIGSKTFLEAVEKKLKDPVLPVRKMAAFVIKKWTGEDHNVEFVKESKASEGK